MANRRILERTKTSVIEEENLFDITEKKINEIYNKNKNKSILIFFKKLFNESKENCKLIENIQDKLINILLLFDITGISYFIQLDKKIIINKEKYIINIMNYSHPNKFFYHFL